MSIGRHILSPSMIEIEREVDGEIVFVYVYSPKVLKMFSFEECAYDGVCEWVGESALVLHSQVMC